MGAIHPICLSCGQVPYFGLYDGFRVHGKFFCSECEQRLLAEEAGSSFYLHIAAKLRSLWHDYGWERLRSGKL